MGNLVIGLGDWSIGSQFNWNNEPIQLPDYQIPQLPDFPRHLSVSAATPGSVRPPTNDMAVILTWLIGGGALVAIPATVGVVAAVVAWGRRDSTRRLVAQLRR